MFMNYSMKNLFYYDFKQKHTMLRRLKSVGALFTVMGLASIESVYANGMPDVASIEIMQQQENCKGGS